MDNGWVISRTGMPGPLLAECLEAAIAAPSVHNTQPWLFRLRDGGVDVLADRSRQLGVIDPQGREVAISVGAAVFNLRVAMLARGRLPILRPLPYPDRPAVLARVSPGPIANRRSDTAHLLAEAIPRRRTNRQPFEDTPVPAPVLADLAVAAKAEGAMLHVLDEERRNAVFGLVRTAENRRRWDAGYQAELSRWAHREPGRRDGVPPEAFGPWPVLESVPIRDFGPARPPRRRHAEFFEHEPVAGVLYSSGDGAREWLRAGQALERTLLTATVHGLATTLMTQPLEFPELRDLLSDAAARRTAQAIIRIGYGPPSPATPRRPLSEVLLPGRASAGVPTR